MKRIGVLGCTGSIGTTTLNVVRASDDIKVELLVNNSDLVGLKRLIAEFSPKIAICLSKRYIYAGGVECELSDENVLSDSGLYNDCDLVVNGIVGLSGLAPTLAVLEAKKILATANKESFVCAGKIIEEYKQKNNGIIYPLDSEHSAVWQLLQTDRAVNRIIITASGGAFRDKSIAELRGSKAVDALRHPNWIMGKKVTIDCATLMNKGMEIIEAKHLFGIIPDVIGHRESYVHALVEYTDGTYNANISVPDMFFPISYALHYPSSAIAKESWELSDKAFNFFKLDEQKFPCLAIAKKTAHRGDIAGCVMNTADEVLVQKYLKDEIKFYDIPEGIERALDEFGGNGDFSSVEEVFRMDKAVREYTLRMSFGGK